LDDRSLIKLEVFVKGPSIALWEGFRFMTFYEFIRLSTSRFLASMKGIYTVPGQKDILGWKGVGTLGLPVLCERKFEGEK
jgi:hypothetical protein